MRFLVPVIFLMTMCPAFAAETDVLWQQYIQEAERAFEQKDYLQARRWFSASLAEAEKCRQDVQLAQSLERLAEKYAARNRCKVAQALHRQAVKIFAKRHLLCKVAWN